MTHFGPELSRFAVMRKRAMLFPLECHLRMCRKDQSVSTRPCQNSASRISPYPSMAMVRVPTKTWGIPRRGGDGAAFLVLSDANVSEDVGQE